MQPNFNLEGLYLLAFYNFPCPKPMSKEEPRNPKRKMNAFCDQIYYVSNLKLCQRPLRHLHLDETLQERPFSGPQREGSPSPPPNAC